MSEFLAPFYRGKVRCKGRGGLIESLKAEGPPGWSWWKPFGPGRAIWDRLATYPELEQELGKLEDAQLSDVGKVRTGNRTLNLRLGEHLPAGMWVKVWMDCGLPWFVRPACRAGYRPKKCTRQELETAILAGEGRLLAWKQEVPGVNRIEWLGKDGSRYRTRIDDKLNVLDAGFCMAGTDREHDLTSLVSASQERAGWWAEVNQHGGLGWS